MTTETPERVRALLALYRESHYDVELAAGAVTLRVGAQPAPAIVAWMDDADAAYFLTASNPRSRPLSSDENLRRVAALRSALDAAGARCLPGVGHMPGERWREPSLFVAGIALACVDAHMRECDQNCILVVMSGRPIRLRVYRPDWQQALGTSPDIDWARSATA